MRTFNNKRAVAKNLMVLAAIAAGTISFDSASSHARAQGLFDSLFRAFNVPAQRTRSFDPALAYGSAPPLFGGPDNPQISPQARPFTGRTTYCVRLCDGRFFPVTSGGRASTAKTCSAMCPASPTKVFSGGAIDDASADDGKRYSDLDNAFVYRSKMVDGCTCNGKDAVGLAPIEVSQDQTLQTGDIVATADGMKVFQGSRSATHKPADFASIESARMGREDRRKIVSLKVTPRADQMVSSRP